MSTYKLTITENQARLISQACELIARLGMGQWREAVEWLPLRDKPDYDAYHADLEAFGRTLSAHMTEGVDGWRSSLGIHHEAIRKEVRDAWDLRTAIRYRLAWDRAVAAGIVKPGERRKWPEMMAVDFDEPMKVGDEAPAKVERIE